MRLVSFILIAFSLLTCNNPTSQNTDKNNKLLPADIIHNPASASENPEKPEQLLPEINFVTESYDFGKISQGEKTVFSFKFKNTGKADLIINKAEASCGCTVPKWPKDPIKPSDEDVIEVIFDSRGKTGLQNKSITILSNTIPNRKNIYIKGEVIADKEGT